MEIFISWKILNSDFYMIYLQKKCLLENVGACIYVANILIRQ